MTEINFEEYETVIEKEGRVFYFSLNARLRREIELDDVLQEARILFLKARETFNPQRASFKTYLSQFIRSRLMNLIRDASRQCRDYRAKMSECECITHDEGDGDLPRDFTALIDRQIFWTHPGEYDEGICQIILKDGLEHIAAGEDKELSFIASQILAGTFTHSQFSRGQLDRLAAAL